ncbi:MAG: hypothetical protein NC548_42765 [Lachnospiraceae bacterium]|nr:hypothetical protein [Lachnospiraceae bacterium]
MGGEGKEEERDTFKGLKIGSFTVAQSSSFLFFFGAFSREKRGIGLDGESGGRGRKRRGLLMCLYTV